MGEVVNLRSARKTQARAGLARKAAENRVAFGLTKAERACIRLAKLQAKAKLDGAKTSHPANLTNEAAKIS